jgi:hypothetical protein
MNMSNNYTETFFGIRGFDFESEKKRLIDNLEWYKSLSVEEHTFAKKYDELQFYKNYAADSSRVKAKIWVPDDINDEKSTIKQIEELKPKVVVVNKPYLETDWNMLRVFCHTMDFNQTPGRFIKLLISDSNDRYLGILSVASDVITIGSRDKYIGWTSENRLNDGKLTHSAIGSCIMATQPFGYNFLGGKLTACLVTSETVRNAWKKIYNDVLVGMTTTSLYGSYSMYNNLKWWHKCGSTTGKILIKPDEKIYQVWHDWIKTNKSTEYEKKLTQKEGVSGPVTSAKLRIIQMIFDSCGIKTSHYTHGYERGSYSSLFYENSKDFFCNKISLDKLVMKPLFKNGDKSILEWWKPKAIERYKKLKQENRLKSDVLFYNKMLNMTYDEAKSYYFNEVGR